MKHGYLSMKGVPTVLLLGLLLVEPCSGQKSEWNARELARRLADARTRQLTVKELPVGARDVLKLLLKWTSNPPPHVDGFQLKLGLVAAFDHLRAEEAIPFLIKNINIRQGSGFPVWGTSSKAHVVDESPAIRALLNIGRPALKPLMDAYFSPLNAQDRLAVLFTVGRMHDPSADTFFHQVRALLAEEKSYADFVLRDPDRRE